MPIYVFVCTECGHEFEHYQPKMTANPAVLLICPMCKGTVERKFSAPYIIVR